MVENVSNISINTTCAVIHTRCSLVCTCVAVLRVRFGISTRVAACSLLLRHPALLRRVLLRRVLLHRDSFRSPTCVCEMQRQWFRRTRLISASKFRTCLAKIPTIALNRLRLLKSRLTRLDCVARLELRNAVLVQATAIGPMKDYHALFGMTSFRRLSK